MLIIKPDFSTLKMLNIYRHGTLLITNDVFTMKKKSFFSKRKGKNYISATVANNRDFETTFGI